MDLLCENHWNLNVLTYFSNHQHQLRITISSNYYMILSEGKCGCNWSKEDRSPPQFGSLPLVVMYYIPDRITHRPPNPFRWWAAALPQNQPEYFFHQGNCFSGYKSTVRPDQSRQSMWHYSRLYSLHMRAPESPTCALKMFHCCCWSFYGGLIK